MYLLSNIFCNARSVRQELRGQRLSEKKRNYRPAGSTHRGNPQGHGEFRKWPTFSSNNSLSSKKNHESTDVFHGCRIMAGNPWWCSASALALFKTPPYSCEDLCWRKNRENKPTRIIKYHKMKVVEDIALLTPQLSGHGHASSSRP